MSAGVVKSFKNKVTKPPLENDRIRDVLDLVASDSRGPAPFRSPMVKGRVKPSQEPDSAKRPHETPSQESVQTFRNMVSGD